MSDDVYANPSLTKKVRFQIGEKEDGKADFCKNTDNVTIYDNYWPEGSTLPELQDSPTKDQEQINGPSIRRHLRLTTVCLVLLCFLLLAAVTAIAVLVVFMIQDESLKANYNEMKSINANLTVERDELQTNNSEMKSINANLTAERDQLQKQIERITCPADWKKVGSGCFFISPLKTIRDSKKFCESHDAQLLTESSLTEQTDLNADIQSIWTFLERRQRKKVTKLVKGTVIGQVRRKMMSQHVYNEADVIEKVHFDEDDKGSKLHIYVSAESLRIYDNPWVESMSSAIPGPAEIRHKAMSVMSETPRKRNHDRCCSVALGAVCLLLLAGIIGIGVQMNKDKTKWDTDRDQLLAVYADLQKTTDQLNSTYTDLRYLLWKKFCQPKPRKCRKLGLTFPDNQDKE
uniref:uncharacterized protein LOC122770616 isoform X2 n=1 Tax=Solea senegalensis TaxID=28829 RepID=UPI001CD909F8|nr:uncharacterized protein LOC122770616 isoform X2 [Solea senegalensis]